jgi:predicted TIM-barrel fold metal-dependent hydrolase
MGVTDDDPGLPFKLWACSNGEYLPAALDDLRIEAMRQARAAADDQARRHGASRREFLLSAAGLAAGLVAMESASRERARHLGVGRGGRFAVPASAIADTAEATSLVHGSAGTAPVIDVQTHFLETPSIGGGFPQAQCGEANPGDCFAVDYWYDLVLGGSDTSVAVISAVPVVGEPDPLSIEAMERGRLHASQLCGDGRVLIQGHAVPNHGPLDAALAAMADISTAHEISAWKVYTHSPQGFFLDDHDPAAPQIGGPFLDAVRASGVPILAVHKGFGGDPPSPFASPVDIGPAAAANPDISFLVYHSGYEGLDTVEAELREDGAGVDRLVHSVTQAGIAPGGNVYAELGSTWRSVMGSPDQAAHVLGKLLTAFGPDRILWGTDSIWYGSPQDQIAAFRNFEITPEFQDRFGYPALTDDIKQRILSSNAAALFGIEPPAARCEPADQAGFRTNRTYGPVSRRDVAATFVREHPWTAAHLQP